MRLLTVLLPLIVVVTTNGKDLLQDGPEYSADKGMDFSDGGPRHLPYQAISDVDSHSLHNVHQNLNKESLTGHKETRKRNLTETCEEAMGKCISKKSICSGSVDKTKACDKKKDVCCISETNQCMAKLHNNSTLYEQIDSSETAITETVNQVNSSLYNKVDTSEAVIIDTIYEVCSNTTSDLEMKINNLESRLRSLEDNFTPKLDNIITGQDNIKEGQSKIGSDIDAKLQSLQETLTNKLDNLNCKQVPTTTPSPTTAECPDDFFKIEGSYQCYKYFTDGQVNWAAAKSKCESNGLLLAVPHDPVAVTHYLHNKYGNSYPWAWVDAKGDESVMRWQRNNQVVSNTFYYPGEPSGVTSNHCIHLLIESGYIGNNPSKPFCTRDCGGTDRYALCERV